MSDQITGSQSTTQNSSAGASDNSTASANTSSNEYSSASMPVVASAELPTAALLNSIANEAAAFSQAYYQWGQQVFNNLQGVTNDNMAALTQSADLAMSGATTTMNAYTNQFLPDYNSLRLTADQYANPARQARNAGAAESDVMQAANQGRLNAEQNLESNGIDTSSGRYADLENAQRTAASSAAAGAGTQSVRADETTALGLQKQALDYGIQLPGIAANFLNQANQARSISENADIGTANAGASLGQLPSAYLNAAMQDKFAPSGTASTSGGSGSSSGGSQGGGQSAQGSQGSGQRSSYGYPNPNDGGAPPGTGGGGGGGGGGGYGGSNTAGKGDMLPLSNPNYDVPGGYSDTFSSGGGGYGGYARGGAIPDPTPGGQVPVQASPSGGQQMDDVHASLTPDEFVIPRDVAKWKGQEFFQKLIAQSRKNLSMAPAKGRPAPPPTGPVAFASRPMR